MLSTALVHAVCLFVIAYIYLTTRETSRWWLTFYVIGIVLNAFFFVIEILDAYGVGA